MLHHPAGQGGAVNRNSAPRAARGRARTLLRRLHCEEDGQALLLEVGFICVVLALLSVAASATAVYLGLETLTSLADSAAAAGANNVEAHPYYRGGITDDTPRSPTGVEVRNRAAEDLPTRLTVIRLEEITIVSARAADSRTTEVRL